jgi:hypothetical protein
MNTIGRRAASVILVSGCWGDGEQRRRLVMRCVMPVETCAKPSGREAAKVRAGRH